LDGVAGVVGAAGVVAGASCAPANAGTIIAAASTAQLIFKFFIIPLGRSKAFSITTVQPGLGSVTSVTG
jgi:hypothetical protein